MSMRLATLKEISGDPAWLNAFANQRKDRRYYEIVEQTLNQGFEHFYLVMENDRGERAIQPLFVHDQDLLAGSGKWLQTAAGLARKIIPRFLKLRTLMVGCPAGEGRLCADWAAPLLAAQLREQARGLRCGMVVMKEFHCESRRPLRALVEAKFTRVPSLPMTRLNIDYADFEQYMAKALSKATRKDLRRKFKAMDNAAPVAMSLIDDLSACVDEVYPLYEAVYNRSALHFEKLNKDFLLRVWREMSDKARFFVWRQNGRAVAFSICLIQGETLFDEYVGLDYSVALDLHLYFVTLRDLIQWGIEHGLKYYCSTALCYEPKLHLRCELEALDLYVAHVSPPFNWLLARFLPWLEPTRNDPALKKYPNYGTLWGEG
jgi:GNAT acetyltransferase-like protein